MLISFLCTTVWSPSHRPGQGDVCPSSSHFWVSKPGPLYPQHSRPGVGCAQSLAHGAAAGDAALGRRPVFQGAGRLWGVAGSPHCSSRRRPGVGHVPHSHLPQGDHEAPVLALAGAVTMTSQVTLATSRFSSSGTTTGQPGLDDPRSLPLECRGWPHVRGCVRTQESGSSSIETGRLCPRRRSWSRRHLSRHAGTTWDARLPGGPLRHFSLETHPEGSPSRQLLPQLMPWFSRPPGS